MTRAEALKLADDEIVKLIANGDETVFYAAGGDQNRIVAAAFRARETLADKIMAEAGIDRHHRPERVKPT